MFDDFLLLSLLSVLNKTISSSHKCYVICMFLHVVNPCVLCPGVEFLPTWAMYGLDILNLSPTSMDKQNSSIIKCNSLKRWHYSMFTPSLLIANFCQLICYFYGDFCKFGNKNVFGTFYVLASQHSILDTCKFCTDFLISSFKPKLFLL